MARWRIEMLGGLTLRDTAGEQAVQTKFYSQKTALLLARLALPPMRTYGREELIELLWPESDLAGGRANLRNVLARLRRQLEPGAADGGQNLQADNSHIRLNSEAVETDVAAFDEWLRRAQRAGGDGESEEALREALALYKGELLPGHYADWLLRERDRLAAARGDALRDLRDLAQRRKDSDEARSLAFRLDEAGEEGVEPLPTDAEAPPPAFWPSAYTRFFGREREMRETQALLRRARLVTLTGMGGVGKTRLAQETALELQRSRAIAAVFTPLEAVRNTDQIVGKIFAALAISPNGQADGVMQVCAELTVRNVSLLILDNFEHLLTEPGDARSVVAALLAGMEGLSVLVTSRQPLNLPGERVYALTPLPLPDANAGPDALMGTASAQIFVNRAKLARPDFAVTPRNAPAIAAICRQLEGIPLSLEIAGARAMVTTPWQMRAGLEQRLNFLARRAARGPSAPTSTASRHQSLRSALEWSHSLLPPDLARCFAALAVFRGGLTPDTVRETCADEDALGHIEELCQASLLCPEERGDAMRFCFLDTVREFAREKLAESGEEAVLRARHYAHFLQMADEGDLALTGPDQEQWLDRLEAEHDNMRAALDWALAQPDPSHALKLGFMLWRFWQTRGYLLEGMEWLRRGLALPGKDTEDAAKKLRAMAQNALGALASNANKFEEARAAFAASIALYGENNPFDLIAPLNNIGLIDLYTGEFAPAIAAFTRCLEIVGADGEAQYRSSFLNNRGMAFLHSGQWEQAQSDLETALQLYQQAGNRRGIAKALNNIGEIALRRGEPGLAEKPLRESLRLHYALGDREAAAMCLEGLAESCLAAGKPERGAAMLGAATAIRAEVSAPVRPVDAANVERVREALLTALGPTVFAAALDAQKTRFAATLQKEAAASNAAG